MLTLHRYLMIFALTLLVTLPISANAQAPAEGRPGILVTPTRVVLEGRKRSEEISIANNGTTTGFYTISLNNKRMLEDGVLEKAEAPKEDEKFADKLIRISPRRVTLAPGEHQTIRLLVRKPSGLEEGEYRSHLTISASPQTDAEKKAQQEESNKDEALSIQIKANFGVSLPIIIRHGTLEAAANIEKLTTYYGEEDKKYHVNVTIARSGKRSLYGDLRITHTAKDGTKTVLKNMLGVAIYTPNTKRVFDIVLDNTENVSLNSGVIEVEYSAKKDAGGALLAKKDISL